MSREHMLYNQAALQSTPSSSSAFPAAFSIDTFAKGPGVLLEGKFAGRSRHTITDSAGNKHRFIVLHVTYSNAYKRQYDDKGKELEASVGKSTKVNTGYLNSSYKLKESDADTISADALQKLLGPTIGKLGKPGQTLSGKNFEFWGEEDVLKTFEFASDDSVRLKTKGDSPFIDTIARLDTKTSSITNFSGDQKVGQSWTDKVMTKGKEASQPAPQDQKQGVDDSEWD